jgi:integrase/recombinase XerC/integrase/recombinase XerD
VDDISFVDETKVLYIMGKGHDEKDAYVKLSPEVYGLIEEYLIERQDEYKPLFINHTKTLHCCKWY